MGVLFVHWDGDVGVRPGAFHRIASFYPIFWHLIHRLDFVFVRTVGIRCIAICKISVCFVNRWVRERNRFDKLPENFGNQVGPVYAAVSSMLIFARKAINQSLLKTVSFRDMILTAHVYCLYNLVTRKHNAASKLCAVIALTEADSPPAIGRMTTCQQQAPII